MPDNEAENKQAPMYLLDFRTMTVKKIEDPINIIDHEAGLEAAALEIAAFFGPNDSPMDAARAGVAAYLRASGLEAERDRLRERLDAETDEAARDAETWRRELGAAVARCDELRAFVDFCAHGMISDQTPAEDFALAVRDQARLLLNRHE